jgi:hypothetical protein
LAWYEEELKFLLVSIFHYVKKTDLTLLMYKNKFQPYDKDFVDKGLYKGETHRKNKKIP